MAAGSDDAGVLTRENKNGLFAEPHFRIVLPEKVSIGPVAGAFHAVKQARLSRDQRTRTDRRGNGAVGEHSLQPGDLALITIPRRRIDGRVDIADDSDIGRPDVVERGAGFDENIKEATKWLAGCSDDLDVEQAIFRLSRGQVGINGADR